MYAYKCGCAIQHCKLKDKLSQQMEIAVLKKYGAGREFQAVRMVGLFGIVKEITLMPKKIRS